MLFGGVVNSMWIIGKSICLCVYFILFVLFYVECDLDVLWYFVLWRYVVEYFYK